MKDFIQIINTSTLEGVPKKSDGSDFIYKPICPPGSAETGQCRVAVVEVPPGKSAFEYHYHETDEEVFYIIRGEGILRTPQGDKSVHAGDCVLLPPGPNGAHAMRNASKTEKLIYIDFDSHNVPDITHYPDSGQVKVQGAFSSAYYDEKSGTPAEPRLKKGVRES